MSTLRRYFTILAFTVLTFPVYADPVLGLPTGDAESLGLSQSKLDAIPGALQNYIDKNQMPGFVTVVAKDGKVVHFEAFGKRDVERDKPMENETIFRMYSMTKPVTGTAVMILVQEGKLSVDDKVSKYIPEFANLKVLTQGSDKPVPADKPMTIQHLLTHTSGLSYAFLPSHVQGIYSESDHNSGDISLEEYAKRVAKLPLMAHPGTQWNYSISMDILGRVVEVVSGQRFGDFLEQRVFAPLQMNDSGFHVNPSNKGRFAANYGPSGGKMILVDDPESSAFLKRPALDSGGGGMVGTAGDYLRFAQMLANDGELDGVRILKKESVDEMLSDQLDPALGTKPLSTMVPVLVEGLGFGYCGSVVRDGVAMTAFGSSGQYSWGGAASTDFWIDRERNMVGLVCTQLIPSGTYPQRVVFHNAMMAAVKK